MSTLDGYTILSSLGCAYVRIVAANRDVVYTAHIVQHGEQIEASPRTSPLLNSLRISPLSSGPNDELYVALLLERMHTLPLKMPKAGRSKLGAISSSAVNPRAFASLNTVPALAFSMRDFPVHMSLMVEYGTPLSLAEPVHGCVMVCYLFFSTSVSRLLENIMPVCRYNVTEGFVVLYRIPVARPDTPQPIPRHSRNRSGLRAV